MAGQAVDLGSVYATLELRTKDFEHGLNSAQSNIRSFSSQASTAFGSIADGIGTVLKATALLTVSTGFGALAFVKSAGALQDTAQSMKVLTGNTETANKLFSQLATYANNTPFEFPDIAKAGKTLLGFGISAEKVFGNVQMLGDIAAATGADLGSLALVFGQVNATGKLMGQDTLQLINNNIPITTILAKKLGVSVKDVKERMAEGAISADLFNEALLGVTQQGGFAFKGTEILAKTLNGRLSTLKDTIFETGRNLLGMRIDPNGAGLIIEQGGAFDRLSKAVESASKWLNDNKETLVKIGGIIFNNFIPAITALVAMFTVAKLAAIGFSISAAIAAGTLSLPFLLGAAAITAVVGALVFLQIKFNIFGKAVEWVRERLEPLFPVFKAIGSFVKDQLVTAFESLKRIWEQLHRAMQPLIDAFQEFWSKHGQKVMTVLKVIGVVVAGIVLAPLIVGFGLLLGALKVMAVVLKFVADHFETIKKVVIVALAVAFAPLIVAVVAVIAIVKAVIAVVKWLIDAFNWTIQAVQAVANFFVSVWQAIYNAVAGPINAIWNVIKFVLELIMNLYIIVFGSILIVILTVFNAVWGFIQSVWNAIWGFLQPILQGIWDFFVAVWNGIKDTAVAVFNALKDFFTTIWNTIYGVIKGIIDKIIGFFAGAWNWLYEHGKGIIGGLINGIKAMAGALWDGISGVSAQIGKFFAGVGSWLFDSGKALFEGFINGMKAIGNKVKETAEGIIKKVRDLLPFSPAKDGPFSGKGWTLYSGRALMKGLASGIADYAHLPTEAMNRALSTVNIPQANASVTGAGSVAQSNATNIYGNINIANQQDADYLLSRLTRRQDLTTQGLIGG